MYELRRASSSCTVEGEQLLAISHASESHPETIGSDSLATEAREAGSLACPEGETGVTQCFSVRLLGVPWDSKKKFTLIEELQLGTVTE